MTPHTSVSGALTKTDPPRRRPVLAIALTLSAAAHVAVAMMLWVEHAPQPEAGAVIDFEIVSAAGLVSSPSAAANAASATDRMQKPEASPPPQPPAPPELPREAGDPPTASPDLAREPPAAAPDPVAMPRSHAALRHPHAAPAPRHAPRLAASSANNPAATTRARASSDPAQRAAVPVVAADAAPSAGPDTGVTTPRYGLGSAANPIPRYPEEARARGWEGVVLLNVSVAADGRAESVRIARSSGHAILDAAALDAVRRWRFEPGRRAGIPVAASVDVPIRFRLED